MTTSELRGALVRAGTFAIEDRKDGSLYVSRMRTLPSRGFLRLAIPRVIAVLHARGEAISVRVRPDAIAWFVIVMCAGGVIVELFTDRAQYPRSYPPAFVYGCASAYAFFLALEHVRTRRAVTAVLDALRRR